MKNYKNISFVFEILIFIVSVVSSVFTIVGTIINNNSSNKMIILPLAIGIIIITIICINKLIKQKLDYSDKFYLISDIFHKTNHFLKDEKNNILNDVSQTLTINMLDDKLKSIIKAQIEALSDILTHNTKQKISVSIKYFDDNIKNIFNAELKTLIRCKNSHRDRPRDNKTIIKEITDYSEIILKNENYFYKSNFKTTDKYNNIMNWNKFYSTRIVVPIRFIPENQLHTLGNKKYYGFICVDAKKAKIFEDELEIYINLICGVADRLYVYFRDYTNMYNELLKEKEVAVNGDINEDISIK
jgi:hypothetical protein